MRSQTRLVRLLPLVFVCAVAALSATASPAAAAAFTNGGTITLPDPNCTDPDKATPYPSPITVSGLGGTVTDVNVTLNGVSHAFEGDIEVLLVGPGGQNIELLSDAGTGSLTNAGVTFDDSAASLAPQNSAWGPGTYKPTNYTELSPPNPPDAFPAPAPAPSGATTLSTFDGTVPTGTWNLYVLDDACPDGGSFGGGWTLNITTASLVATATTIGSSLNPSRTGQSVTFTSHVTAAGFPLTTGTVTFTDGATTLASNVPLNGSGDASFSTSALSEGDHPVKATYNGTASFATSNATVDQRVDNNTAVAGNTYCNTGAITLPVSGTATPYPSNIFVTGTTTALTKLTVTLKTVSHTFEGDIEVLLVGPGGQNIELLSDAGTGTLTNADVTFDDAAAALAPQNTAWGAGTYKPTNYTELSGADVFPAPAPSPSAATTLGTFKNTNANGTWKLYVIDDGAPDSGSIAGGWCLNLTPSSIAPAVVTGSVNWTLRDSLSSGGTDTTFTYGAKPLVPLIGDWDGDGTDTSGTFEGGVFKLRNTNSGPATVTFPFGDARGFPVAGDFDGDGTDDVAVFRNGLWQIRLSTGATPTPFTLGGGSWPATIPVTGDWDGDGTEGIGTYAYSTATWNLRNSASAGSFNVGPVVFGTPNSSYPVTGDWDSNGTDTFGTKQGGSWTLRNSNTAGGGVDSTFTFGLASDLPLIWRVS